MLSCPLNADLSVERRPLGVNWSVSEVHGVLFVPMRQPLPAVCWLSASVVCLVLTVYLFGTYVVVWQAPAGFCVCAELTPIADVRICWLLDWCWAGLRGTRHVVGSSWESDDRRRGREPRDWCECVCVWMWVCVCKCYSVILPLIDENTLHIQHYYVLALSSRATFLTLWRACQDRPWGDKKRKPHSCHPCCNRCTTQC